MPAVLAALVAAVARASGSVGLKSRHHIIGELCDGVGLSASRRHRRSLRHRKHRSHAAPHSAGEHGRGPRLRCLLHGPADASSATSNGGSPSTSNGAFGPVQKHAAGAQAAWRAGWAQLVSASLKRSAAEGEGVFSSTVSSQNCYGTNSAFMCQAWVHEGDALTQLAVFLPDR